MSNLRLHEAKRRLAQAEQRVARQRRLQREQRDAAVNARARSRQTSRKQGLERRQFHIAALMSGSGAGIALGPLDTHAAVMKAMELTDCGYDRIVLKDAATREELHFTAPPGFGQN